MKCDGCNIEFDIKDLKRTYTIKHAKLKTKVEAWNSPEPNCDTLIKKYFCNKCFDGLKDE